MTITVMYSCPLCNVKDERVEIPARESHEVPVVAWMESVIAFIGRHHHAKYPFCSARKLHNLMIPIENAEWIGGPPIT